MGSKPTVIARNYKETLKHCSITQEFLDATLQLPTLPILMGGIELGPSKIHGIGVFSLKNYKTKDFICSTILNGFRVTGGRYVNHSSTPNAVGKGDKGYYCLVAAKEINKGEEVTIDYAQIFDLFSRGKNTIKEVY